MAKDSVTGLPTTPSSTRSSAPSNLVPVYVMVGVVSPGFEQSNGRSITPGGAYPMTPSLRGTDTEVYQMVADLSRGQGYGPGNALVPIPSHFL
jgi:hypothetical protein